MATAKPRLQPYFYVMPHETDLDPEQQTRWRLKPLPPHEKEQLYTVTPEGRLRFMPDKYDKAIKFGLLGWENFKLNGEDVEFNKDNFDLIDPDDRVLIAVEIFNNASLQEPEIKNS